MKIGLRAGHSDNCTGAIGIVNEHEQMKLYYSAVKAVLEEYGHTVVDCNSNANTQNGELAEGATKANNAGVDLFVSLHMNSYNGKAHGTEVLISSTSSASYPYAKRLVNNYAELGFYDRGIKCSKLYEMNHISAPNIISEICFCDNQEDIDIYNKYSWVELAHYFANAIDPNIPKKVSTGTKYKIGWNKDNTGWFYSTDGTEYHTCGWQLIDGDWYYFNYKGYILLGWQNIEGEWYYFRKDSHNEGKLYGGWLDDDNKRYYLEEKHEGNFGKMYKDGTFEIDGVKYSFNKDGSLIE